MTFQITGKKTIFYSKENGNLHSVLLCGTVYYPFSLVQQDIMSAAMPIILSKFCSCVHVLDTGDA